MATTKTATLTIRVEPNLKEALRTAAQAEHRSIANMIEVMIREHCEKNGIAIDNDQELDQRQELKK
ncbi:ribbon-helix-helix protein, CopG family [Vibrio zhugei]|uniref:Ribbon-helix-helix protein, CopG family n=1 Tax=Vibrio zhugei TaxID=2479546 RepID=A0ABV7CCT7_9VIBR|nr:MULTISPECIES: ribbon-helix-helix protein, CopG family [Vibrio]EJU9538015.1 ribbon-helix-helix protein, CopG family [Vibrio alginolyticus]MDW1807643.1 ribbon-helix-helix protein, CopG family [Vibrio sp. Vb2362]MBY7718695.1 ribbon-helix-helix protein, CopG family [Vibrio parahaemolyticus]MCR9497774.1 ribbon-helix-helix protein, CopG family [Vibrio alginolyticus]MCZ6373556.1 ribbon-helix-helix protein, CopG family [Vibrio parahaemolyticus]